MPAVDWIRVVIGGAYQRGRALNESLIHVTRPRESRRVCYRSAHPLRHDLLIRTDRAIEELPAGFRAHGSREHGVEMECRMVVTARSLSIEATICSRIRESPGGSDQGSSAGRSGGGAFRT